MGRDKNVSMFRTVYIKFEKKNIGLGRFEVQSRLTRLSREEREREPFVNRYTKKEHVY